MLEHGGKCAEGDRPVVGTTDAASEKQNVLRHSLLEGCGVFKKFLVEIQEVRRDLARTAHETGGLLGPPALQENIAPLKHIAFHFRLEASRLSPKDSASVLKAYEEMKQVVSFMKQAGDSQERVCWQFSTSSQRPPDWSTDVRLLCLAGCRIGADSRASSRSTFERPPQPVAIAKPGEHFGNVLANGIGEAIKALQGHDAIRQRLEHILGALAAFAKTMIKGTRGEPEHALLVHGNRQSA